MKKLNEFMDNYGYMGLLVIELIVFVIITVRI